MGFHNLAKMTTATTGTGTLSLGTASLGFNTFEDAGVVDQEVVTYCIQDGSSYETGRGTYTSLGQTLARGEILASSNGGAPLDLSGQATVCLTLAAEDLAQFALATHIHAEATTSTAGFVELATETEARTGTDNTLAVTPSGVVASAALVRQNSCSAAYTLALTDAGKHIYHPSSDTTGRTFTIPANSSVAYDLGTALTFVNDIGAGSVTLAIDSDTLVWFPSGGTGSRTLAAGGVATALKVETTRWIITGTGLS